MLHDWLIYNCWWAPKKINDKQEILKKIPPKSLVSDGNITFEIFNWKKEIFILIKSDD